MRKVFAACSGSSSPSPPQLQVPTPSEALEIAREKAEQGGPNQRLSRFKDVPMQPLDPVFGLTEAFNADPNHGKKLNLGVGAYRTEDLKPFLLNVVREAERRIVQKEDRNKEYLPIDGLPEFRKAAADILWGPGSFENPRLSVVQSISGTGSLRLAAEFFKIFMPGKAIFVSDPTWANHNNIFEDAGMQVEVYRYWDTKTMSLDLKGMLEDLENAPEGSVVLLHACAHNPTGLDPGHEEWESIADVIQRKKLFPFFDVAYQGFATGNLEYDAHAPRRFVERGIELAVAQSFAKNLGLYSERVGTLQFFLSDGESARRVHSQCKRIARAIYSNPPSHGAMIVAEILGDADLVNEWKKEVRLMAERIKEARAALSKCLYEEDPSGDWSFVVGQKGMFSYTGLSKPQVKYLEEKYHIYMMKSGRISLAGLPTSQARHLARAMVDAIRTVKD
eukprot:CAMPEP_0184479212 /NCGR_PEP_ID=MMETSP0113_2-20130426/1025_1 /TAXON_ID=91329 /ORGANISM="Norrisiella sphaerica, Strain BC52" /LENGTH=447 /DNA_ID=CAMNT_0026857243 /DNA_START=432 /DNA_END=1775 /DNA_ORIENTATION=-